MRNRKQRSLSKPRTRQASTPSTPTEHLDARRQYLKRQRIKQQKQRKHGVQQQPKRTSKYAAILAMAALKAKRERWAAIAAETQGIVLGDGKYVEERHGGAAATVRVVHDVSAQIQLSRQGTTFYPHYSELLASWAQKHPAAGTRKTTIEFSRSATLTAARHLSHTMIHLHTHSPSSLTLTTLGVLSFASRKRPGGGFLHGGDEQEETMARHSSLVASLSAPNAKDFYKEHRKYWVEDGSGLQDHSMVYSPGVVVFRRDQDDDLMVVGEEPHISTVELAPSEDSVGGDFIPPFTVNVLSSVPVNAAAVRAKHTILPSEEQFFEDGIRSAMKERMARILRLFEERGDRVLVLGAFGCGSSQNNVETVASIWAELLVCGAFEGNEDDGKQCEARFKDTFEGVVFAVPGKLFEPFKKAFEMRIFEEEVMQATLSSP
ncbi:hypothetical protein AcV7_000067 [Taiwanofungus camphoratus]|nr:hypothetical protein AcV7_000067 [Antrodia cinnamomea]